MIKNDLYTAKLKQLEEITARVSECNKECNFIESKKIIDGSFRQLLGINAELAERLSSEDLIKFIGAYESSEVIKIIILSELLKLSGNFFTLQQSTEKGNSYLLRSLSAYMNAISKDSETTLELCRDNIDEIISSVSEYDIPYKIQVGVFKYSEIIGKYDKAEDILYELLEDTENLSEVIQLGINFYNNLTEKKKEDLESGGLPFEEVKEGLARLERK